MDTLITDIIQFIGFFFGGGSLLLTFAAGSASSPSGEGREGFEKRSYSYFSMLQKWSKSWGNGKESCKAVNAPYPTGDVTQVHSAKEGTCGSCISDKSGHYLHLSKGFMAVASLWSRVNSLTLILVPLLCPSWWTAKETHYLFAQFCGSYTHRTSFLCPLETGFGI